MSQAGPVPFRLFATYTQMQCQVSQVIEMSLRWALELSRGGSGLAAVAGIWLGGGVGNEVRLLPVALGSGSGAGGRDQLVSLPSGFQFLCMENGITAMLAS